MISLKTPIESRLNLVLCLFSKIFIRQFFCCHICWFIMTGSRYSHRAALSIFSAWFRQLLPSLFSYKTSILASTSISTI